MKIINDTPVFPFDLERAKNGEAIQFSDLKHPFYYFCDSSNCGWIVIKDKYTLSFEVGSDGEGYAHKSYMLSPDPSTIPAGAKEKFCKGEIFYNAYMESLNVNGNLNGDFIYLFNSDVAYCRLIKYTNWGFQWQTETFGQKNSGWVEFKDLKFID